MKSIITSLFVMLFSFIFVSENAAQSYKIIVNTSNGIASLDEQEASDLFLKKSTKWSNGTPVMPVDQTPGTSIREAFSKDVHGKSTSAIRSYWQQAAFTGTASAPPELGGDQGTIDYVKKHPGAIGYVSASANTADVKTISIK